MPSYSEAIASKRHSGRFRVAMRGESTLRTTYQLLVLTGNAEEVVGCFAFAVADDVHVTAELEAERLVEGAGLLWIGDSEHGVQVARHGRYPARVSRGPFSLEAEPAAAPARPELLFLEDECGRRLAQRPRLRRAREEVDVDTADATPAELDPTRGASVIRRRLLATLNRGEKRRCDDPRGALRECPGFRDADRSHVA